MAHVISASWALLLFLLLLVATSDATIINITNRCPHTVWPGALPGGGMQLDPGKSWMLDVSAGTTSSGMRIWPRTGCSFGANGNGSCQTGDCGGVLACKTSGQPPNTMAEFSIGEGSTDFFKISLVDGFNVPMDIFPVQVKGGPECTSWPQCADNITSNCPDKLQTPGGCNSACPKNAATGCEPTIYSMFFVRMCPDAYSYSQDNNSSTIFACPTGINYHVSFCPDIPKVVGYMIANFPSSNVTSSPPNPSDPIAPAPTSMNASSSKVGTILGSVVGLILFVAFITLFLYPYFYALRFFFVHKRRAQQHQKMEEEEEEFGNLQGIPVRFTFKQLEVATEQFRDKLGEGGFGSVFKGRLGEESIAVKRLDRAGQGKREFLAEVETVGSIHHINLVRLIGFCAEKSHRLLVYEYIPRGSLDRWIYCRHDNSAPPLDWRTRCRIIADIAKGLSYLHEECVKRIAHLDVKPQNILLDDNFNAKLSDFGLCKLIDRDMSQVVTKMRGTPGYLAPEWLTSQITEKVDIYSFGVVVMEIISGRKNLDTARSEESIHLITLLEEKVKTENLLDLIDNSSEDMQVHKQDAVEMMRLAMWCLQVDCKRRPKMSEVVKVLEGTLNAETNIDHTFVATSPVTFGIAGNVSASAAPVASHLSGPR